MGKRTSIILDKEILKKISMLAKKQNLDRSKMIRKLIENGLGKNIIKDVELIKIQRRQEKALADLEHWTKERDKIINNQNEELERQKERQKVKAEEARINKVISDYVGKLIELKNEPKKQIVLLNKALKKEKDKKIVNYIKKQLRRLGEN